MHLLSALVVAVSLLQGATTGGSQSSPASPTGSPNWPPPGTFAPGDGVSLPGLSHEVKPAYTLEAMRAKIAGTVLVRAVVREDGSVTDAEVVRSLDTVYGLDQEALKAVRQWRFTPGRRNGAPVPVQITVELSFTLKDSPPAATSAAWLATVSIPVPTGYIVAPLPFQGLFESIGGGDVDLLGSYAPADAVTSLARRPTPGLDMAIVATPRDIKETEIDEASFATLAQGLHANLTMGSTLEEAARRADELRASTQRTVALTTTQPLGFFDDGMDRVGVLAAQPMQAGDQSVGIVMATTLIRVRNHVVMAYMFSTRMDADGVMSLAVAARAWTNAILQANK